MPIIAEGKRLFLGVPAEVIPESPTGTQIYNVQCYYCGHVDTIPQNSYLELRAKKRESLGYLDAVSYGQGECPMCSIREERSRQRWAEIESWGFPDF